MSKRRKRGSGRDRGETAKRSPDAPKQLPPANPPKRNPTMLAISLALFSGWFLFLVYVAFFR